MALGPVLASRHDHCMDGFRIGQFRGIDLRLNWSVVIIGVLITWSLAESVFPDNVDGTHSETEFWIVGALTAAGFLAALLAHELGHSVVALRHEVGVTGITLWMFGGIAVLGSEPKTPTAALRIAVAGPAVSAVIGVVTIAITPLFGGLGHVALLWFGVMNLVLVAFNLLPAFPLDGGRIYQAWEWRRVGDKDVATERAARVGLHVGGVLVAVGFIELLWGALVGGLWLVMIGMFIREAARAEWRQGVIAKPLATMSVSQVMTPDPLTVSADITIDAFIAGVFFGGRHAAYPVTDEAGSVVGLITLNKVRELGQSVTDQVTVGEVATRLEDLTIASPNQSVADLLPALSGRTESRVLVFDGEVLAGIVAPSDLARLVSVLDLAHPGAR